ncbi:peptidoglycan-binding protein [Methylocystis bryophila]|nr:peptidoglycan-binding protein [Methylocystis bryophila]
MNKPNYKQLRAEIQSLSSAARTRVVRAKDRRGDASRDFDDEKTEDDFLLENDAKGLPVSDEGDDSSEDSPHRTRRFATNERHNTRALQKIAQLVDERRNSVRLDQALDALSRSINASERRTARALETIVAELIEDDLAPSAGEQRPNRAQSAAPSTAPDQQLAPQFDAGGDDSERSPKDLAGSPEKEAPRSDTPETPRAQSESAIVALPLADAILEVTRRRRALDADAHADDRGSDEPRVRAAGESGAQPLEEIERKIAVLAKRVEAMLGGQEAQPDRSSERLDHAAFRRNLLNAENVTFSHRALDEIVGLRRQLDDAIGKSYPALSARSNEMRAEMEALTRQLDSLRGDLDNSAERERHIMLQVDGLREEIRGLSRGVGELASRASVEAIDRALSDLAERVGAQRAKGVEDQALAPAERIAGELRAVIENLDPRPHMRELDADVRAMADRLDRLETAGDADAAALQELARCAAEIKSALSALAARPLPQEQIETRVRDLTIRVDKLTPAPSFAGEGSSELVDAAKAIRAILSAETGLGAFNQRLDRLSDRLEEALARFDGDRLDELGARIDEMHQSLAQRIDQGIAQTPPHVAALEGLLGDLAKKVDQALSASAAPVAVASLEGKVDRLDEKLDRLSEGAFAKKLEELLAKVKPREENRFGEIATRLDVMQRALAKQIDESTRRHKDDTHKAQLSALLEQLANRSAEAFGPGADSAAINGLSEQVRQLSTRLDRSLIDSAALAAIESKITELCEKIEISRANAAAETEGSISGEAPCARQELESDERREAPERGREAETVAQDAPERVAALPSGHEDRRSESPDGESQGQSFWSATSEGAQEECGEEECGESALAEAPEEPRLPVVYATPRWGQGLQVVTDSDSGGIGAPSSARPSGVDLELRQQTEFIAAARRAAERASAGGIPPRDRKITIRELAANCNSDTGPQPPVPVSNRKKLLIAGLTGVALIAAAAPIGRAVLDQTQNVSALDAKAIGADVGAAQKFALNASPPPAKQFSLPELNRTDTKSASNGTAVENAKEATGDGPAAKAERKSAAAERLDTTPVGAIEKAPASLPLDPALLQAQALRGDAKAQFELGLRYAEGRGGLARDPQLAAQWFAKSADQGLALAQYRLGSLYEKGVSVERDLGRARSLYEKAANAGNARAMHNLGVLFVENGDGWPDYVSAAGWFRKAAELGVRDSQFNLAVLYARGTGVEENLVQAYMWFSVAASQGDAEAAKKRDEVATRLDARDLAAGKSMAEAFKPKERARDANETEPPRSTAPSLNPSDKQSDAPAARATSNRRKLSGM